MEIESPFVKKYKLEKRLNKKKNTSYYSKGKKNNLSSLLNSKKKMSKEKSSMPSLKNHKTLQANNYSSLIEGNTDPTNSGFWLNSSISKKPIHLKKKISRIRLLSLDHNSHISEGNEQNLVNHIDHLLNVNKYGLIHFNLIIRFKD